jgi:hypothetical protein
VKVCVCVCECEGVCVCVCEGVCMYVCVVCEGMWVCVRAREGGYRCSVSGRNALMSVSLAAVTPVTRF